jgi:hypothetical protein
MVYFKHRHFPAGLPQFKAVDWQGNEPVEKIRSTEKLTRNKAGKNKFVVYDSSLSSRPDFVI